MTICFFTNWGWDGSVSKEQVQAASHAVDVQIFKPTSPSHPAHSKYKSMQMKSNSEIKMSRRSPQNQAPDNCKLMHFYYYKFMHVSLLILQQQFICTARTYEHVRSMKTCLLTLQLLKKQLLWHTNFPIDVLMNTIHLLEYVKIFRHLKSHYTYLK